jgi:hypothetical protein
MLLIAAALMAGGSALASAQPLDQDGSRDHDRFHDRDDRGFRDRDRDHDRDIGRDRGRFVGERRVVKGYHWRWDGRRWCR